MEINPDFTFNHDRSIMYATLISLSPKFTRAIIKRIPAWLLRKMEFQQLCHRPQVAFLPLVEDNGTFRPGPQPSLAVKAPQEETAAKFTATCSTDGRWIRRFGDRGVVLLGRENAWYP
ncbi:hypothetical protein BKA57DRAFT_506357 [Linnemannia elongata]|nr:hypothetical protein BKA57DRAFT_506357 [Linnemannia elongata]